MERIIVIRRERNQELDHKLCFLLSKSGEGWSIDPPWEFVGEWLIGRDEKEARRIASMFGVPLLDKSELEYNEVSSDASWQEIIGTD